METHMADVQKVLIVGGGIAGMASAIRFGEAGVAVDLIDIDPEWRVYGAGITITGPTLRAYKRLGLLEAIKAEGAITNGSRIFRFDGVHLQDFDEPALEEGLPATGGIMRPILHRIMQARVKELGTSVRLGLTVSALENENENDDVNVTFSDGSTGRYDLVVGADSINSQVRQLAFPHMREAEHTGQGCWRISIAKPPGLDRGEFYFGHQFPAGITPCGVNKVYMWMLTPHVRREKHFDDVELYDNLKANLAPFGGSAGWIRDNMSRDDWVNYRPLVAALQPGSWFAGRIVLVGDSVHATTPHLASGAGIAVESAIVLVDELLNAANVEAGLQAYQERRFERCRDVVETSVAVGKLQLGGGSPDQIGGMMGGALHRLAGDF
jgi:2-polyprenyl-6-methoxyphenol hydroxylase-like FAD-dependent oxidoreductase